MHMYKFFLLYYFFAVLIYDGRQAKAKVLFRKMSGMRNCSKIVIVNCKMRNCKISKTAFETKFLSGMCQVL